MSSKDEEKRILRMVYSEDKYVVEGEIEQPDFRLNTLDDGFVFGVEITELYANESSARLKKIDNYVNDIIDNEKYRHKKDKKDLPIVTFASIPEGDEQSMTFKGVHIKKPPNLIMMIKNLENAIRSKTEKAKKYDDTLSVIDLVVYDYECNYNSIKVDDLYGYVYTSQMEETLNECGFREVYFITNSSDGESIYLRLKTQMFLKSCLCLLKC